MANTVDQLIKDQVLMNVSETATVQHALELMGEGNYSQLPVVNEDGRVVGLFTERQVANAVRIGMGCDLATARVSKWMEKKPRIVPPDCRIHDVAGMFADALAVIVGAHNELMGIVTEYDIAAYLAEWSKGISLVEDIEKQLRGFIKRVLPTDQAKEAALVHAFGVDKQSLDKPAIAYGEMTLQEHIQLIITEANWQHFEPYFGNKAEFRKLMDAARRVRNDVAHFRGKLTPGQLRTLETASQWLGKCHRVTDHFGAPAGLLTQGGTQTTTD